VERHEIEGLARGGDGVLGALEAIAQEIAGSEQVVELLILVVAQLDLAPVDAEQVLGPVGAIVIALCAIFKAGSSLIGWTLTISQSAAAAAKDGLFPKLFARVDARGIPRLNFVITGTLMSLIVVLTASPTLAKQFNEIIDMAIILTILPYMYSGVAFLKIGVEAGTNRWHHYLVVGIVAVVSIYCLWVVAGSDADLTRSAMIILFASVPLYPMFARRLKD